MSNLRTVVKIGAHRILWTPGGGGGTETDLGFTTEGCQIDIAYSAYERTVHELAAPFDAVVDNIEITSAITLVDGSVDTLAAALAGIKTTVTGPPAKSGMDINPARGRQLPFGKLVFRPRSKTGVGGTDLTEDKTIFNAIVIPTGPRVFRANADQTVTFNIKAGAFWDATASKWKFYAEGDPTALDGFAI